MELKVETIYRPRYRFLFFWLRSRFSRWKEGSKKLARGCEAFNFVQNFVNNLSDICRLLQECNDLMDNLARWQVFFFFFFLMWTCFVLSASLCFMLHARGTGKARGRIGQSDLARKLGQASSSLAPVVQRLDNAIHRINRYPVDKCWQNKPRYPLDSDLSGG